MEAPILLLETKVDKFIEEVLFEGELAVAFHGFVIHSADDQVKEYKKYQEGLKDLLTSLSE
ncbi:mediator of RNA polymerase II transcription subunit 23, partial [Trichonephila clavata]